MSKSVFSSCNERLEDQIGSEMGLDAESESISVSFNNQNKSENTKKTQFIRNDITSEYPLKKVMFSTSL